MISPVIMYGRLMRQLQYFLQQLFRQIEIKIHDLSKETMQILILSINHVRKAHLKVVKYVNDMLSMSGTTSDGGLEVVFEVTVSTDKQVYIASQDSNAIKYPNYITRWSALWTSIQH